MTYLKIRVTGPRLRKKKNGRKKVTEGLLTDKGLYLQMHLQNTGAQGCATERGNRQRWEDLRGV